MKRIAICPGSFDPVTLGHIDVITRSAKLYDEVIVGVSNNPRKQCLFTLPERIDLLTGALSHLNNVNIDSFDKLLVDFCAEHHAHAVVKGLRAVSDFEYEFMMAQMNRKLDPGVETVFIMASPEFAYLSSSAVREIAEYGGDVSGLVTPNVQARLAARLQGERGR